MNIDANPPPIQICQDGTGWYLQIYNPEISIDTANTVKISGPLQPLPKEEESYLNDRGRQWKQLVFIEATTCAVRYIDQKEPPPGRFATNLWFLQRDEARRLLELSHNSAAYKQRLKIVAGTTAMVGLMTSSDIVQFCFPNTNGLVYCDTVPVTEGW